MALYGKGVTLPPAVLRGCTAVLLSQDIMENLSDSNKPAVTVCNGKRSMYMSQNHHID